ncbi:hypothetical protein BVK86_09700 [Pseudomonas reinekei]|uniref:Uncharacterized protein n=1 Tax=Pseudomonas reinekei TaxID=395598 RepID=A0A1Q9WXM8_PSERE|nr:hypothetical protein F7R15_09780 [Pseudomonas reinekei]OLU03548.1 hypothetical protein BVK86_09700 [Pseudomonas reinekei]
MRRIVCRRFGASICLRTGATRCKNDRGFAESVNLRQRVVAGRNQRPVQGPAVEPEFAALLNLGRCNEIDLPGFGTDSDWRTRG